MNKQSYSLPGLIPWLGLAVERACQAPWSFNPGAAEFNPQAEPLGLGSVKAGRSKPSAWLGTPSQEQCLLTEKADKLLAPSVSVWVAGPPSSGINRVECSQRSASPQAHALPTTSLKNHVLWSPVKISLCLWGWPCVFWEEVGYVFVF